MLTQHTGLQRGGGFNTATRQLALPRICASTQAGCWQHRRCQPPCGAHIMLTLAKSTELAALQKPQFRTSRPLLSQILRSQPSAPPVQCTAGHPVSSAEAALPAPLWTPPPVFCAAPGSSRHEADFVMGHMRPDAHNTWLSFCSSFCSLRPSSLAFHGYIIGLYSA
jgi:hypothetical protein